MPDLNRRRMLTSLGMVGGATVVGAAHGVNTATDEADPSQAVPPPCWNYTQLDPDAIAARTYRMYPDGGCMYALVGSVISELADRHGEPFRSFPYEMMRYGAGGVGEWGSLCGVVNGATALIGLFYRDAPKEKREALAGELCSWYEQTALPQYEPTQPALDYEPPTTIADSVLCHVSVAKWSQESDCNPFSPEKKERCRRLTADGARKTVEVLNREAAGIAMTLPLLAPAVESCVECHGKDGMATATGRMSCHSCHDIGRGHP